jgi:hypothetical protein
MHADSGLLGLDAIRRTSVAPPRAIRGIYFLFRRGRLQYVGKSIDVMGRVVQHQRKVKFDRFAVVECRHDEMADLEVAYIVMLKPPLNNHSNTACVRCEGTTLWEKRTTSTERMRRTAPRLRAMKAIARYLARDVTRYPKGL